MDKIDWAKFTDALRTKEQKQTLAEMTGIQSAHHNSDGTITIVKPAAMGKTTCIEMLKVYETLGKIAVQTKPKLAKTDTDKLVDEIMAKGNK